VSQMTSDMFRFSYSQPGPFLTILMTYHRVCNKRNTTGATCEAGTAYPSGGPDLLSVLSRVRIVRSLVFCVRFCRSMFVFLFFFFWALCCLSFDLRLLMTPLTS
jgi:hypothetical protein